MYCSGITYRILKFVASLVFLAAVKLQAQTPFNPQQLPDLKLWLAADSGIVVNGSTVQEWKDISGNSNHATQTSNGFQPMYVPGAINTKPALHFGKNGSGGDETYLSFPQMTLTPGNFTIVCFYKTGAATNPVHFILGGSGQGLSSNGTSFPGIVIFDGSNLLQSTGVYSSYSLSSFTNSTIYRNGSQLSTTGSPVGTIDLNTVGARPDFLPGFFWGDVFEILVYNTQLADSSRIAVENYLFDKYAPPLNLGLDITVCSFPLVLKAKKDHFTNYLWQDNSTEDSLVINSAGTYYLTVTDIFGRTSSDTIVITQDNTSYDVSLGADTSICSGEQLLITAGPTHYSYTWSNSGTTNYIITDTSGSYTVTTTDCLGHSSTDSITVIVQPLPQFSLGNDTSICFNNAYFLDPDVQSNFDLVYNWFDGSNDTTHAVSSTGSYSLTVETDIGCSFADTILISIDSSLAMLSLGADASACGSYVLSPGTSVPAGLTYQWNDNSANDSITVLSTGQYWVVVNNSNNCSAKDTADITILPVPVFSLGFDTSICYNSGYIINPNLANASQYSFNWSDASDDSTLTPNQSGVYWVNVTNSVNCSSIDSVEVLIDSSLFITSLGPDTSLCAGNFISLVTGDMPGLSYEWNDNTTNPSLVINTSGQYYLTVTNSQHCSKTDTIQVTVSGSAPVADFSTSLSCENNLISFTDLSMPPVGNVITGWHWNFGNNTTLADTSVLQNPSYTYVDPGMYTINLVVETNAGCKQILTRNIDVYPIPVVSFSNTLACRNDSALFTNASSSPGYTPLSYIWNFGDPASGINNTSSLADPAHIFSQQTNYSVKLITINSAGCKDSISQNINVRAEVSADFTYSTPCTNAPVVLQDNSIAPAPNNMNIRNWTIGSTTYTGITASHLFPASGTFPVKLVVTGSNGCISSIIKNIDVHAAPLAQFIANPICVRDTFKPLDQSVAQSGSITDWKWESNGVVVSTAQNPELVFPFAGTNSIELAIQDSFGCKDSVSNSLTIHPLPNPNFTTNPAALYFVNTPVTFIPVATNGAMYIWTVNSLNYSGAPFSYIFSDTGTIVVSLRVTDSNNCSAALIKDLEIKDRMLDLAVLNVRTTKDNEGYITMEADLANFGTVPVTAFEIEGHVANASAVKESWSGIPASGSYFTYTFNSRVKQITAVDDYITCMHITSVNGTADAVETNNTLCATTISNRTLVLDPYPNPGKESTTLPLTLKNDAEITFRLIDHLGRDVSNTFTTQGKKGLNLIPVSLSSVNNGQYLIVIIIEDKVFTKKITRTD